MKRTLLYALAIFFALGFLASLFLLMTGNLMAGILASVLSMAMTSLLLRGAERAPVRKSRTLRGAGWLSGIAIAMALVAIILIL